MKNIEQWSATKFDLKSGRLRSNVGARSWLAADGVARAYDRHLHYAAGRLLDLGCGEVPLYVAYKDRVSDIICVDWEGTEHDSRHVDIACDLTAMLPFGAEFDTIILSDVLEHIPEPENVWSEMFRVLRPGGKVLLNVPFFYQIHEEPHDFYRYTRFALDRFARRAGFEVLVLEPLGGIPEILADILAKVLSSLGKLGAAVALGIQKAATLFRPISRKSAATFPFGYFMVVQKPLAMDSSTTTCTGSQA